MFPGMDVAQMMWKSPDVVKLPIKTVVSRFVSLRWPLTNVGDVSTIVEGQPGILLRTLGRARVRWRRWRMSFQPSTSALLS